jgi:hypothetical protein
MVSEDEERFGWIQMASIVPPSIRTDVRRVERSRSLKPSFRRIRFVEPWGSLHRS